MYFVGFYFCFLLENGFVNVFKCLEINGLNVKMFLKIIFAVRFLLDAFIG